MLLNTSNISRNPYGNFSKDADIDLRKQLTKILSQEKRGSFFIYRRVRRDSKGYPIVADSSLTNRSAEPTFGTNKGMKYLFDDYTVRGYLSTGSTFHEPGKVVKYGDSRTDSGMLFLEYDSLYKITGNNRDLPDSYDKLILPDYNIEGELISPLKVRLRYDIGSAEPYRLQEFGRVEFIKINLLSNFDESIQL